MQSLPRPAESAIFPPTKGEIEGEGEANEKKRGRGTFEATCQLQCSNEAGETTVQVREETSPMVVYRQLGRENLLVARRLAGSRTCKPRESHDRLRVQPAAPVR